MRYPVSDAAGLAASTIALDECAGVPVDVAQWARSLRATLSRALLLADTSSLDGDAIDRPELLRTLRT